MIKKQSTVIAFLLIFAMCLPTVTLATNTSVNSSEYLTSYSAYVWPEGNGEISIWFDVTGTGTMDEIGALTIILQASSNESTWNTVKTFSYSDYPNMLEYDSVDCVSGVYYSGIAGMYYRAYVTVWAGKDGSGDSRQILTATVQA